MHNTSTFLQVKSVSAIRNNYLTFLCVFLFADWVLFDKLFLATLVF